ncbi:hypothetical protein [Chamaesiphon sp. OTE_75_metabat_556]|uniref:hypothetical protein n=1 Tax=Chamaesiphon sp. OTE_75_metabat_556 TaxID=2964692 RepID=UPI00286CABE1|nr:hypothetical protein [Chamaesiphon sp. OTE_75_metabat_556]
MIVFHQFKIVARKELSYINFPIFSQLQFDRFEQTFQGSLKQKSKRAAMANR